MLDSFRSLAGSLMAKILLTILLVSFGIWGIGDMVRNPGGSGYVASVGAEKIDARAYDRELRTAKDDIRRMLGDRYSPEVMNNLDLPRHVLKKLVDQSLLRQESAALGLVPSDADVVRHIRSNAAFQDASGNFDKALFEATLQRANTTEKQFIDKLRKDMATGLLLDTLTDAAPQAPITAQTLFAAREEQRIAGFYVLNATLVENVPTPNSDQLKDYYEAHPGDFTAPEYRTLSYVVLSPDSAHDDTPPSLDALKRSYQERSEEFRRPERRGLMQMLFDSEEKAKAAEAELKSGKHFEQVALNQNALNKTSLSMGKVERAQVLADAGDMVFALPVGTPSAPVKSAFGWIIFEVGSIEPPSVAPFDEVRPTLEKEARRQNSIEALSKLTASLEDALAGGATLAEAAQNLKLPLKTIGPISHDGLTPADAKDANVPALNKFLDTAFKTDEKTESPMITSSGGTDYILRVDSVTPEHLKPFDDVKAKVLIGWQQAQREEKLSELVKKIAAGFKDKHQRDAVIAQYHLKPAFNASLHRTSHMAGDNPLPPELIADLFVQAPQGSTDAYPFKDGNYTLAVVGKINPAPAADSDPKLKDTLADIQKQLQTNTQHEIIDQYTRYLASKYAVSVDEAALQRAGK